MIPKREEIQFAMTDEVERQTTLRGEDARRYAQGLLAGYVLGLEHGTEHRQAWPSPSVARYVVVQALRCERQEFLGGVSE